MSVDRCAKALSVPGTGEVKAGPRGFTLIELLIVVVIIGLLAAIALPRFANTRDRAHRSQVQTDLRTLVTAQEAYFDLSHEYATDVAQLQYNNSPGVQVQIIETAANGWSASATHASAPTVECAVYVGPVSAPTGVVPGITEGVIACN
jgi:prepilin-type N-terminal cleavage/methylation domain-containing protein